MPADGIPKIYWDSCVILSYLEGDPERIGDLDAIIQEQREEKCELITSVISRAEIIYVADLDDAESAATIDELWTPESPITLVEVFDQITAEAQQIALARKRAGLKKVKPLDAIHIASALRYATKMHTYDKPLHALSNSVGMHIGFPEAVQPQLPPATGGYVS
jgi:predicted nucleic acid-binding protein